MSASTQRRIELSKLWKTRVQEWQKAGKSARSWCQEQDLPYNQFIYWKGRIQPNETSLRFVEIVDKQTVHSSIEIEIMDAVIKISGDFDERVLKKCLCALRAESC